MAFTRLAWNSALLLGLAGLALLAAAPAHAAPKGASAPAKVATGLKPAAVVPFKPGSATAPTRDYGGIRLMDAIAMDTLPGVSLRWSPLSETLLLRVEGTPSVEMRFTLGNPYASVKGDLLSLPTFPFREGERFWVPVDPVLNALDSLLPYQLSLADSAPTLQWKAEEEFLGMKIEERRNGTLVDLRFAKAPHYESFLTRPHFLIRLNDLKLKGDTLDRAFTEGQIRKITTIANPNSTQLTFEINHLVDTVEVVPRDEGRTLALVFRRPDAPAAAAKISADSSLAKAEKGTSGAKGEKGAKGAKTPLGKPTGKFKTIIIDPGHGGEDPGAPGRKSNEKDITLAVGKLLAEELKARGYEPKLTRDKDVLIPLKERPELASKWGGDLFLSLHCDAIPDKKKFDKVRGFKAFILREALDEEDKAIARRENSFIDASSEAKKKADLTPVEWILLEHQLNLYTKESEILAADLVESMQKWGSIPNSGTGAGQAGFYVLVGAFMPAALIEMGFISNPEDEALLTSPQGQRQMAKRIADGVDAYRAHAEEMK